MRQMTLEELKRWQTAQKQRSRRRANDFAKFMITAFEVGNCDAPYRAGTSDEFDGGWHLFFHRISKGAAPEISPEVKQTFQQV
jgi:hypothetical protein